MGHKSKYELDNDEYDSKKKWNASKKRDARKDKDERVKAYDLLVPVTSYIRRRVG